MRLRPAATGRPTRQCVTACAGRLRASLPVPWRKPALFDLLRDEPEPGVRVVLGHFLFVYVHPYPDGNGRVGRFLMNVMLTASRYPWTVIPVERRDTYMGALEAASVRQDIGPFTDSLAGLVGEANQS